MKDRYQETPHTRLAGLERSVRFLIRRQQIPKNHPVPGDGSDEAIIDSTENVGDAWGVHSAGPETDGHVLTADGTGGSLWAPGGGGAGGGGIQFDTDPQTGDWLVVETTATIPGHLNDGMQLYSYGDIEIQNTSTDNTGNVVVAGDSGVGITGRGDQGVVINATGDGDLLLVTSGGLGAYITLELGSGSLLRIKGLPTSNPGVAGGNYVWRDSSGYLRIG